MKKMKLIRKLPPKYINGRCVSFAIFWCDFCKSEVVKPITSKYYMSCGCFQYELASESRKGKINSFKHGETGTRLYNIWALIKQRCTNPKSKSYQNYGGRGITICPEWSDNYTVFRDWALSNGYAGGLQINRINNNGNYEPNNCEWTTCVNNIHHRGSNKLTINMVKEIRRRYSTGKYTQVELAKKYKISNSSLSLLLSNKSWRM